MAKKGTTGGPRSHRVTEDDIKRRKEYKSRAEKDRFWQRRALIVTALLIGASVIVLAYAIFNEQILVPRQAITKVNGDKITTSDFQDRVRFTRWLTAQQIREMYYLVGGDVNTLQQYAGTQISQLQSPIMMGSTVLDEMEEELLLAQAAKERNITVNTDDVDRRVDEYIAGGYGLSLPDDGEPATPTLTPTVTVTPLVSPTPSNTPRPTNTATLIPSVTPAEDEPTATSGPTLTPTETSTPTTTPTPTPTLSTDEIYATVDSGAEDFYDTAKDISDVGRSVVRDVFYYDALRTALKDEIIKDVPTEELQVNARHILISFAPDAAAAGETPPPPTDDERADALTRAEQVMDALQDGEPFADLARTMSDDTGSGADGGELGWASPDGYVAAFQDAVLESEIGAIVGPIETEYGYHIIQVMGREVRELTPSALSTKQSEAFQAWVDEQRTNADISRNSDWLDRIPEKPSYETLLGDILG
ncbi:MAG: peptidyl-prolyl cis-trans isomerase [Anaerolineae bacterium]|nr:peptidyl-prolyl cis-trans isomerase [Anaerolineae bacterium]